MSLKRLIGILVFIAYSQFARAQGNWGGGVDDEPLHFGYSFHAININPKFKDLSEAHGGVFPGFGLGFLADLRLGDNANIRFNPLLNFSDREIPSSPSSQKLETFTIDFPLGFKLKSDRQKNFRAYTLAGIKYARDITKKNSNTLSTVVLKKDILWYEIGAGLDIYFEFFKLSPEIKFSNSAHSVIDKTRSVGSYPDSFFFRNIQFSLFFE